MSSIRLDAVTVPNFKTLISVTIQGDGQARQPVDDILHHSVLDQRSATSLNSGLQSETFGSIATDSASPQSSRSRIVRSQAASVATFQLPSADLCADTSGVNLLENKTVSVGIVKPMVHEPDDDDVVDVDAMVVGDQEPVLLEDSDVGTTNVILIVDRSGSMAGAWIDMTKEALVKLIPDDGTSSNLRFVSLVLFDHEVEVHDTSRMSTSQVRQLIKTIHAGGGTNFEGPMRELRLFIARHRLTNLSVLMCTDGKECGGQWTREFRPLQNAIRTSGIKLSFNFLAFTQNADVDFFLSLKNLSNIPSTVQQLDRVDMLRNAILRLADLLDISRHVTLAIVGQEEILLEERAFVPMDSSSSVSQITQNFRRGGQSLPVTSQRQRTIHEITDFDELSAVLLALIMDIRKLVNTETPKDEIKAKCESLKQLVDSLFESDEPKQMAWKSSTQYKLVTDALVQVTNQLEDPVIESDSMVTDGARRPVLGTLFGGQQRAMAMPQMFCMAFGGPSFGTNSADFSTHRAASVQKPCESYQSSCFGDSKAPIRDRRREMEMFFSSPAIRMASTQRTAGEKMEKHTEKTEVDGQDSTFIDPSNVS